MFTLCMPHKSSIFVPAIPQPAIPPPTSTTYDPNHQCTKCLLTPSGPALCPDALVPTPSLDSLPANMAAESYIGPPQATSQVSLPSGLQVGERLAPQDIPLPHSHHVYLYTRSSLLLPPSSSLVFSLLRTTLHSTYNTLQRNLQRRNAWRIHPTHHVSHPIEGTDRFIHKSQ